MELKVEQIVVGGPADTELHAEVYGSPTIATEEDHTDGLQAECRPGVTWAEHPQKDLERLTCPSPPP
jgi:hypothetical protein